MDKRRMCPNCRAFISSSDRVCPYCEVKLGPRIIDRRLPDDLLGGFIPHARFVTVLILTINVWLYAATVLYSMKAGHNALMNVDGGTLFQFGAKYRDAIFLGQWWRLITAGFLHGGLFHLLMNSWILFDLGAQVEEVYGARRLVVIYFLSTIFGFLASTFWTPALSIGASAGVFGLIGAMIALVMGTRSSLGAAIQGQYIRWAIYWLLMGFLPFFAADNAAHIGGLAAGFGAAYLAGVPGLVEGWKEKLWGVAAAACLVLTAASFFLMFVWFNITGR